MRQFIEMKFMNNANRKIQSKPFLFKKFTIAQDRCTMKVGTDGVLLGAWASAKGISSVLDIGTGTGVIAIMMAQRSPESIIHGVEIDEEAYKQAKENMQNSPWSARLKAFNLPIQQYAKQADDTYDLILSNPPFFSGGTFSYKQERNNVRHTVKLPHGDLLIAVRELLKVDGKFCVILPFIEGLRFVELAASYSFYCTKMTQVRPKEDKLVERLLIQFELHQKETEKDELIIQNEGRNEWTEGYIALTGDFYLKM